METDMTREEAIKELRGFIGQLTEGCQEAIKVLIPELAESEDERIRRHLIDIVETYWGTTNEPGKAADLAWLEKQKDSPMPEDIVIFQKGVAEGRRLEREGLPYWQIFKGIGTIIPDNYVLAKFGKGYKLIGPGDTIEIGTVFLQVSQLDNLPKEEKQKEQKPPITGNDFGWIDELKHDFEHPEELDQKVDDVLKQRKGIRTLEWSEEDEHRRIDAIYFLENAKSHYADTSEIEKTILWLKSLKNRGNFPKSNTNSPSWSEEDEKMRMTAIEACKTVAEDYENSNSRFLKCKAWLESLPVGFIINPQYNSDMVELLVSELQAIAKNNGTLKQYDAEITWLKSLRPQPKQVWSKEDEMYLSQAIETLEHEDYLILADKLKSLRPSWKPSEHQMNILKAVKEYVGRGSGYWGEGLGSLINDLEKLM